MAVVRRVYMHEEGLCRLATEPYRNDAQSFGNRFIHLTNYSINRKSSRYEPGTTRCANPAWCCCQPQKGCVVNGPMAEHGKLSNPRAGSWRWDATTLQNTLLKHVLGTHPRAIFALVFD